MPKDKDAVAEQILMQAGPIFAEAGYQGTTVRAICQAAGVNIASVNYYFGDKERLYIEAVKHARRLIERRWPLAEELEALGPEERFRNLIHTIVHRLLSNETQAWQMKLLLREIVEPTKACEEMVQEGFQPFFAQLIDAIRQMTPPGTSESMLHRLGFSVVGQCIFYRTNYRIVEMMISQTELSEAFSIKQIAEHIERFSLAAIRNLSDLHPPLKSRDSLET